MKPWQNHTLDIEAADTNFPLGERQRSARFTLESNMYNKVPFTNSKWEGNVYCDLSIKSHEEFNEEPRLPQNEQLLFLHQLLTSSVDEQSTEVENERAQQRGIKTTWVKGAEIDILPPR